MSASASGINPNKPHLVVVTYVYHARPGGDTSVVDSKFERQLESPEQFFQRELVVGQEWVGLTHCWIEKPGMVVISSGEGAPDLIEVAYADDNGDVPPNSPVWFIHPNESHQGVPSSLTSLRFRCRSGQALVTVSVIPA